MNIGVKTGRAWQEWEGQVFSGEFRLLKCLHTGDRGAVFRTERLRGEPRKAAIKILALDDSNAEAQLARWKSSALLPHPHLVRLFEMGRARLGDIPCAYVVMEYAEEDLSQVDRPLTETEAGDVLAASLKVLAFLHAKRFAHGHLKASNVMAVNDQLKISSDSIRPMGEWRSDLDVPVPLDPPEIVQRGASSAGDVWSLGITLVNALTTQSPSWEAGAIAASLRESLPAAFRVMVAGCLRRDPEKRWTIADLEKFLQSEIEVPPPSQPTPARLPISQPTSPQPAASRPALPQHTLPPAALLQYAPPRRSTSQATRPGASSAKLRYLLLAGVIASALAAVAIVPRLIRDRAPSEAPVVTPSVSQSEPIVKPPPPDDALSKAPVNAPPPPALRQGIQKQVLPDVPAQARNTIRGKLVVRIRVAVDAGGSVIDATNESPGSSRYFGNLALQAARQWKFTPADASRDSGSQEWILRFQFLKDPKNAVSVQAAPAK